MARNHVEIDSRALTRQLQRAMRRNPTVTTKTVRDIVLDLAGRSARRAPVDTGDLRNNCSATVNGSEVFKNQAACGTVNPSQRVEAEVGYSLPYALRQHEELNYNHPKGGEPKFLENPYLENDERYIRKLKAIPEEVFE